MSSAGLAPTTPPPPTGLINAAPGLSTTTPGTTPPGSPGPGSPVTAYNPANATASTATATPYTVPDNAKVASQLHDIIASGSPLMEQAEANARSMMNQRGLINSSMGVTAGDSALISSALPIAQQDAQTQATAATKTGDALNTAELQNSQLQTQTSQYNAGSSNTALSQAATASNSAAQIAQQIQGSKDVATLQTNTQQAIAGLQADTSLSIEDKQAQLQTLIAGIQSNTSLTLQDKQSATQMALQASQATLQTQLANIQADTSLSIEDQQTKSQQLIAQWNNQNAQVVQQIQNAGNLANIQANGQINTQITDITNANKTLLQTSQGAASLYSQSLQNLSAIITNTNMSPDQKAAALNDGVQQLNDGLAVLSQISGIPEMESLLNFATPPANDNTTAQTNFGT